VHGPSGAFRILYIEQWRMLNRTFDDLAVASRTHVVTIPHDQGAERVQGAVVSANLFSVLAIPPAIGRTISADDESAQRRVVVVSASFWKQRWGSSPSILGSALDTDGIPTTVTGVMPASFQFPSKDTQLIDARVRASVLMQDGYSKCERALDHCRRRRC
jgi:hypothetical protein